MLLQKSPLEFMPNELGIKINVDENQIELIISNKGIVRDMIMNEEDNIVEFIETPMDSIKLIDLLRIAEQNRNCFKIQHADSPDYDSRVNNFEYFSKQRLIYVDSSDIYTQISIPHIEKKEEVFVVDSYALIELEKGATKLQQEYIEHDSYISLEDAAIKYLINKIGDPIDSKVYYNVFGVYEIWEYKG